MIGLFHITITSQWPRWRLESPASRLFIYSTVYSGADQRKHQGSTSLAFVWGIHRTKGQLRGKCFHLMTSSRRPISSLWNSPRCDRKTLYGLVNMALSMKKSQSWQIERKPYLAISVKSSLTVYIQTMFPVMGRYIDSNYHNKARAKWRIFYRWHFQLHFPKNGIVFCSCRYEVSIGLVQTLCWTEKSLSEPMMAQFTDTHLHHRASTIHLSIGFNAVFERPRQPQMMMIYYCRS